MAESAEPLEPDTEYVRLKPSTMVAGGAALARDETGRVVFVEGALPGEEVTARLTESRTDFARASTIAVLEASPDRIVPPCSAVEAGCGGCTWQHISPDAQRRLKSQIVVDTLRRIGRFAEPPVPSIVTGDGPALRTTARLAVSPAGRAGYRRRRGAEAVETDACLASHPLLAELITVGRYPGRTEVLMRVGVASGERLVRGRPSGGAGAVRVPDGVRVVGDDESAAVHETVADRSFQISVDSFFQPGPVAAAGLIDAVSAAIDGALGAGDHLVDAYAGVGLFASVLGAATKARVTAIESDGSAVADARVNLADIEAKIVGSDVGRWRPRRGDRPIDVVVADPPRPGLGRPGVATVLAVRSARVVLVSCDPASFARDAALLRDGGYNLETVALVDAFPHTFHVEIVSRFDLPGN
ncbi:MAG TPA: TRAM domain-containing protein [Acidimicrobiales bacterium]|nr:TRAM domain-containing protein [Acidimicrobiales bacterium]